MNDQNDNLIVLQRIRNRIIEVLELFSDDSYFTSAIANLEFWGDWVDSEKIDNYGEPVFQTNELEELMKVNAAWERVQVDSQQNSREWIELSQASQLAARVFMIRGKLPEDSAHA